MLSTSEIRAAIMLLREEHTTISIAAQRHFEVDLSDGQRGQRLTLEYAADVVKVIWVKDEALGHALFSYFDGYFQQADISERRHELFAALCVP